MSFLLSDVSFSQLICLLKFRPCHENYSFLTRALIALSLDHQSAFFSQCNGFFTHSDGCFLPPDSWLRFSASEEKAFKRIWHIIASEGSYLGLFFPHCRGHFAIGIKHECAPDARPIRMSVITDTVTSGPLCTEFQMVCTYFGQLNCSTSHVQSKIFKIETTFLIENEIKRFLTC